MSILSPAEIADIEAEYANAYDQVGTILRPSSGRNNAGEYASEADSDEYLPTPASPVPCMVVLPQNRIQFEEPKIADKVQGQSYWFIIFPLGTDVTEKDRVQVGSVLYEVLVVPTQSQSFKFRVRVVVILVKDQ